jgi:hypothetical protein
MTALCIFRHYLAVAASVIASASYATSIIVPNSLAHVEGNINNTAPFGGDGVRYQQVYHSSQFANVRPGGALLTQISFRPDSSFANATTWTIPSIQIEFSTVSRNPLELDGTFANNIGPDRTTVYGPGSLTLSTSHSGPSTGPKSFDVHIPLLTPFFYDPSAGNLLMDVTVLEPSRDPMFPLRALDAVDGDPSMSRVYIDNGASPTAYAAAGRDYGLVTQFTFVPEPSSSALVACSVLAAIGRRPQRFAT